MKILVIAPIAHQILNALNASFGHTDIVAWDDLSDQLRVGFIAGIENYITHPDATIDQLHDTWVAEKKAAGWVYGEEKDIDNKIHPFIAPFDELPQERKTFDAALQAIVFALKDIPDEAAVAASDGDGVIATAPVANLHLPDGTQPITYIGRRETFTDHLYGSKLPFFQGQTRAVPFDLARKFLKHTDLFERAKDFTPEPAPVDEDSDDDTDELLKTAQKSKEETELKQQEVQHLYDQINQMQEKEAVVEFIHTKYQQKLPKTLSLENLKQRAIGFVDQFGAI